MNGRAFLDAATVPLVGGELCLDFVNTTGARDSKQPRERLRAWDDVVAWSDRVRLTRVGWPRRRALNPRAARAAVQRVRRVRETLYRVLLAVADARRPARRDVAALDRLTRNDRARRTLVVDQHGARLHVTSATTPVEELIFSVVASAVALLLTERARALKRCAECDWLFLDETKNRSRTWCKKACGDRVRARRYYRTQRRDAHVTQGAGRR
jgi:predicted RNA-binding Zn ribbon-like protein